MLGFGGAEIGFESAAQADVSRLLGAALDAGLNVIDTAECYGGYKGMPASEELIGQAVSHRRGEFHLFTKVGHTAGLEGTDWDPEMMRRSIDRSLRRLGVDHVDLLQLHTCTEEVLRKGDVIAVLQRARQAGKTRFIGFSGDSAAARYAVDCAAFDTLQTSVNLADQESIDLTLPAAAAAGMGVIAKRPIANVAWSTGRTAPGGYPQTYWERLRRLAYPFLPEEGGADDRSVGTALRFTLAQSAVSTAIVGTKNPERWRANAALLDRGLLTSDEVRAIRERWLVVREPDWIGQE